MGEDGGCLTANDWATKEWPVGWLISGDGEDDEDVEEDGMTRIESHQCMYDNQIEIYRKKMQCRARRVRLLHIVYTCACMGLQPLPAVAILVECGCVGVTLQMLAVVGKDSVWTGVPTASIVVGQEEDQVRAGSSEANGIDQGVEAPLAAENYFLAQYQAYLTSGVATDSFCLQFPCVWRVLDTNTLLLLRMHCCHVTHILLLQHLHPWWCWVPSRWPN